MKTIIEMARVAGVRDDGHRFEFSEYKYLELFVALIRADEREACAKVCEETTASWTQYLYNEGCTDCAKGIRARGNT